VDFVGVEYSFTETSVEVRATVKAVYKTGVEMEALAAATVAVLTIYDMTKMVDEEVDISAVRLLAKKGGKSDFTPPSGVSATVITVSDTRTASDDESGPRAVAVLQEMGVVKIETKLVRDDPAAIEEAVRAASGQLIVLTGGTGVGPRDNTPEVVSRLIEKELPGVSEQIRRYGQDRTPMSMLSRSVCGLFGDRIVLALPGSPGGVEDGLRAVMPHLLHVLYVVSGAAHA
jgi:molybdenum cofactor synthesis domain-containing protein